MCFTENNERNRQSHGGRVLWKLGKQLWKVWEHGEAGWTPRGEWGEEPVQKHQPVYRERYTLLPPIYKHTYSTCVFHTIEQFTWLVMHLDYLRSLFISCLLIEFPWWNAASEIYAQCKFPQNMKSTPPQLHLKTPVFYPSRKRHATPFLKMLQSQLNYNRDLISSILQSVSTIGSQIALSVKRIPFEGKRCMKWDSTAKKKTKTKPNNRNCHRCLSNG